MSLRLVSADGTLAFELRPGLPLVLGRALSSDLPVLDPTISRRHAELLATSSSVVVRDLGSSNGTFVGGERVTEVKLHPNDGIIFGKVTFEIRGQAELLVDDATAEIRSRAARAGTTIMRQVPVPGAEEALASALLASGATRTDETATILSQHERDRRRLSLLVEISKALTRSTSEEALLERMLDFAFRVVDIEYAAIQLFDGATLSRTQDGSPEMRPLPAGMIRTAIEQQVAILSDTMDATQRPTPTSSNPGPHAAACAPLIASEKRVIGVLYVEAKGLAIHLSDEELDLLVAFAGIGAVALDNLQFAERSRRETKVRENFERFFTPHMADRIATMTGDVSLGGERRMVSVLFADIRGFTPIAASMAPDDTARLLSEFFTEMVECVFRHGGTLDKFMGDAVMAQWGAPLSAADDADRAVSAALDMLDSVTQLNEKWEKEGRPTIQIGIGLNTGIAFAGHTGSVRRLEYTVIGDSVNTASRLCAWAEGGEILVSESVRDALTRSHRLESRPPLILRGKPDPVTVFRALR